MTADTPPPCDRQCLRTLLEQALALADGNDPLVAAHLATALALLGRAAGQSSSR